MTKKEPKDKQIADEREELKAEIARLRGALREVKRIAKLNLSWTPGYMLGLEPRLGRGPDRP
jgi:hypothetical protein